MRARLKFTTDFVPESLVGILKDTDGGRILTRHPPTHGLSPTPFSEPLIPMTFLPSSAALSNTSSLIWVANPRVLCPWSMMFTFFVFSILTCIYCKGPVRRL